MELSYAGSVTMFMDFLGYGNHVELYSEEISPGGEGLGVSDNLPISGVRCMLTSASEYTASVLTCYADFGCIQSGQGAGLSERALSCVVVSGCECISW
jgi:hypothetical protein